MFNSKWYHNLIRPYLAPPDWLFKPVWIFLYITIFTALVLFYKSPSPNKKAGYFCFAVQILLNLIWPFVFFGMKKIAIGLAIIVLLDIFVFLTVKKFYSASKASAYTLLLYFLWILFATYLNIGYLILN